MHESWGAKTGKVYQCCECYVKEGNPPSDWHSGCMLAYKAEQQKTVA
jgi:hypothetical protein